ncbi:MAG: CHAD domain-containing protein [Gammaproteobacteria bacterium]|nr:CHAD domain-containing protein [Gammaproteobacteria bacterium]
MPDNPHSFVIPDDQSISVLVSLLQDNFTVQVLPESVEHRVFYDTFDWRLYKNGSAFEMHDDGRSRKIYWRKDKDAKLKIQLGLKKVPHLAAELPACELRQQLEAVISVRELLPRIKLRIKRQSLTVLDENKKVVVRLDLDVYWHSASRLRAARVLTKRLVIKSVKGYAKDYRRVEALFLAMQLQPAQNNIMKLALIVSGVSPVEYTAQLNLLLDPEMSTELALKKILHRLLEIMQQNTSGSLSGKDTEFIHDYLLSIQKIRAALKQINDVLPPAVNTKYEKFFSTLDELTGPIRNLDVFLLQLENYQADFQTSEWQQLQALREYLLRSRAEMQKKFIDSVKSSRYRKNIKQWRDYLENSGTESFPPDKASQSVYKLADELLLDFYQQTLQQGNVIASGNKAGDGAFDKLRDTLKKMLYLMAFFQSLYPAGKMRLLIQVLTDLQNKLEESSTLSINIGMVKAFVKQSKDEDAVQASTQMIDILQRQQHETEKMFKNCYAAYSSSANQKKFKEMFVDYHS